MSITTTPHVNFRGQAREALAFYQSVFGGQTSIVTYEDIHAVENARPKPTTSPSGASTPPTASRSWPTTCNRPRAMTRARNSYYITLQGTDGDEIQPLWDALAASADNILIPLAPAPFAPLYGMLTDRHGVTWIIGADTTPSTA